MRMDPRRRHAGGRGRAIHLGHNQENFRHAHTAAAKEKIVFGTKEEIAHSNPDAERAAEIVALSNANSKKEEVADADSDRDATPKEKRVADSNAVGDASRISDTYANAITNTCG